MSVPLTLSRSEGGRQPSVSDRPPRPSGWIPRPRLEQALTVASHSRGPDRGHRSTGVGQNRAVIELGRNREHPYGGVVRVDSIRQRPRLLHTALGGCRVLG